MDPSRELDKFMWKLRKLSIDEYKVADDEPIDLEKLPVPTLESTLDKYLRSVKAIIKSEDFDSVKIKVDEMYGQVGKMLQQHLIQFAENKENWVRKIWLDEFYLSNRQSLVINSNPGMIFQRKNFDNLNHYFKYSARLVAGILDYKSVIDRKDLPIDRARHNKKGQPLCMDQYLCLFGTHRRAGKDIDVQLKCRTIDVEYISVMMNNKMFYITLDDYSCYSENFIYQQICIIYQVCQEMKFSKAPSCEISYLTSLQRNKWFNISNKLKNTSSANSNLFNIVENSLFTVCLDVLKDYNYEKKPRTPDVVAAHRMIHGGGINYFSGNRYFDKTMQLISSNDGLCGLCYEHSAAEGIAVVQLIEYLLEYLDVKKNTKLARIPSCDEKTHPKIFNWNINDDIHHDITDAKLQLEKNYGKLVASYESASIRRYKHGRVDNIRSCTLQALEWSTAVKNKNSDQVGLFKKAMKAQTEIMLDAILGYGIDNHLLVLHKMSQMNNLATPDMFTDKAYIQSNHFILSTSQVPTNEPSSFMCYGPVVTDGYGVCYNPHGNNVVFVVTSYSAAETTSSVDLANSIMKSLDIIHGYFS